MSGVRIQTEQAYQEAIAWDDGCISDTTRNDFVIPYLVTLLTRERKLTILDIGTGTGYIPRSVDTKLDYRPHWTLIDADSNRILVAEQRKHPEMQCSYQIGDIARIASSERTFDAVLLTFTLLEADNAKAMLALAAQSLSTDGLLIVAVPDVWRDALDAGEKQPTILHRLLDEVVDVPKIDKFTGSPYPFYALRTETLIATVLEYACVLESLRTVGQQNDVYLLVFRKQASHGQRERG